MRDDWRTRLRRIIAETPGLTMKGLSLKAGLNASTVRTLLTRGSSPTAETLIAVANALGVSPNYLLTGDEGSVVSIPIVGIASGGEGWVPIEDGGNGSVEFELGAHDTIAIEVRGNSMSPVYRSGDVLICHRQFGSNADNLIGLDCVMRTTEGNHYVKILNRGSRTGRFNLRSYDPSERDIEDVALTWIAPVRWVKRGGR